MTRPLLSVVRLSVWVVFATVLASSPLQARTPGQVLPFDVGAQGQTVTVVLTSGWDTATFDGGLTIFASGSAGGPIIARVPVLPPFDFNVEAGIEPTFNFGGVPPSIYYIVMVSGIVGTPAVPASAWRQVVVSGGCSAPPATAFVSRDDDAAPGTLRLFMGSGDGCASTLELEAGTTPGSSNIATLTNLGQFFVTSTPPPGRYYVRARGRNAFGAGPYSSVLPISVPACTSEPVSFGLGYVNVSVVGRTVTLSWAPVSAPAGFPVTFYELLLYFQSVPGQPVHDAAAAPEHDQPLGDRGARHLHGGTRGW